MTTVYNNGTGQLLGDTLGTCRPIQASGNIWYVYSVTGSDGASPAGKNETQPLATLKQALVNSANDDIICLMDGHAEANAADADWTTSKRVHIVGGGLSGGLPTVKLTVGNGETATGIVFNGAGASLRNVWIAERTGTSATPRVTVAADGCLVSSCYFPCSQHDQGPALQINACTAPSIRDCNFVVTATVSGDKPDSAIKLNGAITRMRMSGVVFDGGAFGWGQPYAFNSGSNAITGMNFEAISLLRGSDMLFASSTTGYLNVQTASGGSRVDW